MKTWLISDTHFGHKNIIEYCNRPENHNELMIENWLDLVAEEDEIIHLGDVFMGKGSKEYAEWVFELLPGQKKLILGNHDHASVSFYESLGFEVYPTYKVWVPHEENGLAGSVVMTHYPLCRDYSTWKMNIHGHIHNNGHAPGTPRKRSYRNVSVEATGYAPVLLDDVIRGYKGWSRSESGDWPFSLTVSMEKRGRLDKHFCEIERLDKKLLI